MKKLNYLFTIIILTILFQNINAQVPEYELVAQNFSLNCGVYTQIEWDLYLRNTNAIPLEYLQGQYSFNFDPEIAQGGTLTFQVIASDLPLNLRPGPGTVSGSQLRLAPNTSVPPGSGFIISSSYPGTKVARVRLTTSATSFIVNNNMNSKNQMNLYWRNGPVNPFTKIFATVGNSITDITDSSGTRVEPDYTGHFIFQTLPWEECYARLLNLNAAIEGLYNTSTNSLNRIDTVTVELHDGSSPYSLLSSFRSRLDSINLSTFSPQSSPWWPPNPNFFYIAIKHHNSIETWSKVAVYLSRAGYVSSYSFIDSDTSAFGNNLKILGSTYCIYSGDVNQDKVIDLTDVVLIYNDSQLFTTGYVNTDLDGDYVVNLIDITIAYNSAINFVTAITPM